MAKLFNVRPADIDPNAIKIFPIGSLLVNSLTADVYMVIEPQVGQKEARLIGSDGKYQILQHLQNAHIIQSHTPTTFDKSTIWYNTDVVYVEPGDATEAYMTIRAETTKGSGVYEWRKILPVSMARNVIIGKDNAGQKLTLDTLIRRNRTVVIPSVDVEEASKGEIYIESDNTIWWKTGPNPSDKRLLASGNPFIIERLRKNIHIGNNPPRDWSKDTLWWKLGNDADIINSLTYSIYKAGNTISTGLKFAKDFENKIKEASVLSALDKVATIDLNTTHEFGHIVANYNFLPNTKSYFELNINDPQAKLYLLFLKSNVSQPTSDTYGTELNENTLKIGQDKAKFKNVETTKAFPMHGKTIFITVDKTTTTAGISLGYVLDDGTLQYVHGSATTSGFTMNASHFAIGSSTSVEANSKAIVKISTFKVGEIPNGFTGINNVLPGEDAFENIAPLTNAQSVYLTNSQTLANIHAGAGRLITTPRRYDVVGNASAKAGELIWQNTNNTLWAKADDGSIVPIAGQYDERIVKHLRQSMQVILSDVETYVKDPDDPSRAFIMKNTLNKAGEATGEKYPDLRRNTTNNKVIRGNISVIDNSTTGDRSTYKKIIPFTDTLGTFHDWKAFRTKVAMYTDLKTYLDELHKLIENFLLTDSVYSSFTEFGITDNDLTTSYSTDTLFLREIATNRMINESIYLETCNKLDPSNPTPRQINRIFNVPESGLITCYKDNNNKLQITLHTQSGSKYTANISNNYKIVRWNKMIIDDNGITEIPKNLNVNKAATVAENITVTGWTVANGGIYSRNDRWYIRAENAALNTTPMNVLSYAGTSAQNDTTIFMGDDDKWDYIGFGSKNKPYWYRKLNNGTFKKEYWILQEDIDRAWNYKGSLIEAGSPKDLNNIKNDDSVGYYILPSNVSKISSNYPTDNERGFLEVAKEGNFFIQRYTSHGDNTMTVFTRYWNGTTWSPWQRTVNTYDLSLKFDKAGGSVTGDTTFEKNLLVNKYAIFKDTVSFKSKISSTIDSPFGSSEDLFEIRKEGNNKFLQAGNRNINFHFNTKEVPKWVDNSSGSNVIKELALKESVDTLANDLHDNYTNTTEMNKLLAKKVDKTSYDEEKKNFMKRNGDSATGNYTFTKGTFKIGNETTTDLTSSVLKLPAGLQNNTVADNSVEFAKANLPTGVFSYKTPSSENPNTTVISFANFSTSSGFPTNAYFRVYNNGDLAYAFSKDNNTTVSDFNKFVFRSHIVDNFLGGENKVLSANAGKILHAMTVGRSRGSISQFITGNAYDAAQMVKIEPGNYYVNGDNELQKLGLDKNKVKNEGLLISLSANDVSLKSFVYIPITNSTKADTIGILNLNTSSGSTWAYISDDRYFYSKPEIITLLKDLKEEILSKIMSLEYSYTGNNKNLSIPYRLVHTHNQFNLTGVNPQEALTFYTNIDLSNNAINSTSATVQIHIRGFAEGSGYPIETILTAKLRQNGSNLEIAKKDEYLMTPASVSYTTDIEDNKLIFKVQDNITNEGLSFDTYIRINNAGNTKFNPKVTHYKVGNGSKVESIKLMDDTYVAKNTGPFNKN